MSAAARRAMQRAKSTAIALAAPMTTVRLAGDPRPMGFDGGNVALDPVTREICLYAAELLKRRGLLPRDAGAIDAMLVPPATVVFVRADAGQAEVCRVTVNLVEPDETAEGAQGLVDTFRGVRR